MSWSPMSRRIMLPIVGAATAATTMFSTALPMVQQAAAAPDAPRANNLRVADPGDGTFESCSAYFGFGKNDATAIDMVAFDVDDQNGADGVSHAVPTDTQVVFVLTNSKGDTLECTPVEVTEAQWNEVYDNENWVPIAQRTAWPGPGHYAYPSVAYEPWIEADDFGTVTDVQFRVVGSPGNHTLISPTGLVQLKQHQPTGGEYDSLENSPWLEAVISAEVGPAAATAYTDALTSCGGADSLVNTAALRSAMDFVATYMGWTDFDPETDLHCSAILSVNSNATFVAGMTATASYTEPIVLALPEVEPPASSTTTTTVAAKGVTTKASPATPVSATPRYTG